MSIMKGKLRRSAVVVAFSLGAFQALSIIGANVAQAATACGVSSPGVLTITASADKDNIVIYQDNTVAGGIRVSGGNGAVKPVLGTATDLVNCGNAGVTAATVGTITSIIITGDSGGGLAGDETVFIEMAKYTPGAPAVVTTTLANWGAINWTISLGGNGANGDSLVVEAAGNTTAGINVTGGANGLDLNTDGDLDVTVAGTELFYFDSLSDGAPATATTNPGNTVDLNGSTITGAAFASGAVIGQHPTALNLGYAASVPLSFMATNLGDDILNGGAGNDTIKGGDGADTIEPGLGNDNVDCLTDASPAGLGFEGDGNDTIDYSNTTTAVNVNLPGLTVTQGTEVDAIVGAAAISSCENVLGTSAADTFMGDAAYNWILPGDGNDTVDGGTDTLLNGVDYSDAAAGVTVDLIAGTATGGSGSDTLKHINDVFGSGENDDITGNANLNLLWGWDGNDTLSGGAGDGDGADGFDGGDGIDTISYANNTRSTNVALFGAAACTFIATTCSVTNGVSGEADEIAINTIENAILGSGNDTFTGSVFNNIVWPNGGQNAITGGAGGIDTVNYSQGYTAGVLVNLSGGGASGGNQDSITGFTNAVGTAFDDTLIGTDVVLGTNGANLLVGGKGNDSVSANAGPDLVRAGAGNDRVRGGSGDDTLMGQGGKDNIRGSGGADDIFGGKGKDFCTGGGGNDFIKTCERPRHNGQGPNGPGLHQRI